MARILVLGAGMMGSALTLPLADRGHDVRLVGTHLDDDIVARLRADHVHPKLDVPLPPGVTPFRHTELAQAAQGGLDMLALGVSSAGIAWAVERIRPIVTAGMPVFMITKGLVLRDGALVTLPDEVQRGLAPEVAASTFPAAVAGPCIAGELARRVPTCVVLAGRHAPTLDAIAAALRTDYYHVFPTTDVTGAEACAALKNAYAMGIAFATGLHEKRGGVPGSVAMHNLESAVFAQSVLEMQRLVGLLGGAPETVAGLAGAGDLDVTTNGGRTGRFGRLLGLGLARDEAIARMAGATLECLEILAVMRAAVREFEARGEVTAGAFPLLEHMAAVALDGAPVDLPLARFFNAAARRG